MNNKILKIKNCYCIIRIYYLYDKDKSRIIEADLMSEKWTKYHYYFRHLSEKYVDFKFFL